MAASKIMMALMLILAISGMVSAQTISPVLLAEINTKCGGNILAVLIKDGPKCYEKMLKTKKSCPSSCKNLIKASPNAACANTVVKALPDAIKAKTLKVCKKNLAAVGAKV